MDEDKLKKMKTANALLDEKYGESGTESREEFKAKAKLGTMLKSCAKSAENGISARASSLPIQNPQ